MPSNHVLSTDFSRETLASESDEVFVWLVEINHRSLGEPIRLSSDKTELYGYSEDNGDPIYCTRHNGKVFIEAPFAFVPPGNAEDGSVPQARFVVAAEPRIIQAVRGIHDGLTLESKFVYAADPDTVLGEMPRLWLSSVSYDGAQLEAVLTVDHWLDEPCGWIRFMPSIFPALFKNGVAVK